MGAVLIDGEVSAIPSEFAVIIPQTNIGSSGVLEFAGERYGLKGDASYDNTTRMQEAINEIQKVGGELLLSPGRYATGPLVLGEVGFRRHMSIRGLGRNSDVQSDLSTDKMGVVLGLMNNAQSALFTMRPDQGPVHFDSISVYGNQANQNNDAARGFDFPDASYAQRSGTLRRIRIERVRGTPIRIGQHRNAGQIHEVVALNCGFLPNATPANGGAGVDGLLFGSCSDWRVTNSDFGGMSRNGIYCTGAGSIELINTNSFSNLANGYRVDNTAGDTRWYGGSLDRNSQNGAFFLGHVNKDANFKNIIQNTILGANSRLSDNIYSDFRLLDCEDDVIIKDVYFTKGGASAFLVKYNIFIEGTTRRVQVSGLRRSGETPSASTAFCNKPEELIQEGINGSPQIRGDGVIALPVPATTTTTMAKGDLKWSDEAKGPVYSDGTIWKPLNSAITSPLFAVDGDSVIAASTSQDTATQKGYFVQGPQFWIQAKTHQKARTRPDLNFAVAGHTSTDMLAGVEAVCASDALLVIAQIGTNDLTGMTSMVTFDTYKSNVMAYVRRVLRSGKLLILVCPLNRSLVSATARPLLQHMIKWIRSLRLLGLPNLYIVDPNQRWTDPLSTTSAPKTYYDYDGLHPRGLGSYHIWSQVADVVNEIFPGMPASRMCSITDIFEATYNPTGNMLPNGLFAGSNAIAGSGGPTFTGTQADNTVILASAGGGTITGLTVNGFQDFLSNGLPAQGITISGTGTGSGASPGSGIIVRQTVVSPQSKVLAGDTFEAGVRMELSAGIQNIAGVRLRVRSTENSLTYDQVDGWDTIADLLPSNADSWSLRTQPRTAGFNCSAIEYSIWIALRNQSGVPFAGTFKFGEGFVGRTVT